MNRSRAFIMVLATGVIGYVGLPYLPDGAEMLSGATAAKEQAASLRAKAAKADQALTDQEGFGQALAAARTAVPVEPGLPEMIDKLETAVVASGMRWTSGSPAPAAADGSSSSWTMNLTLRGSADQVPALLSSLRDLDRLVVVDSVQLRGDLDATVVVSLRFFAAVGSPESFEKPAEGQ